MLTVEPCRKLAAQAQAPAPARRTLTLTLCLREEETKANSPIPEERYTLIPTQAHFHPFTATHTTTRSPLRRLPPPALASDRAGQAASLCIF